MALHIFQAFFGIVALYLGARWLILSSVVLARWFGLGKLTIGLTIIAYATGAPELIVSMIATLRDEGAISVGNIIGSNIINTFLVMGIALLIRPIRVRTDVIHRDFIWMIIGYAMMVFALQRGVIGRYEGFVFVVLLLYIVYKQIFTVIDFHQQEIETKTIAFKHIAFVALGGLLLFFGADYLVNSTVNIALHFGISKKIIAVTIVAIGTSLPELSAAIYSSIANQEDMTLGNILGSNIFNIFGVLGLCSLIQPIEFHGTSFNYSMTCMVISSVILVLISWIKETLGRGTGFTLITLYFLYIWGLIH